MLAEILTRSNLRLLAGGRSCERGEEYFEEGQVGPIKENEDSVGAKVHGTRSYDVRLKIVPAEKGKLRLDHFCTCPVGRDGDFCKHCVALGLAWLAKTATVGRVPAAKKHPSITLKEIRGWLEQQEVAVLLDLVMAQVENDSRLRESLVLKLARENARGIDLTAWKREVRSAFHAGGYVDYYDMGEYLAGVGTMLDSLDRVLSEGFAEEAMLLAEYAAQEAGRAVRDTDDSDGGFWEIGERIATLHLDACKALKPEPQALARRLFALETTENELECFDDAAQRYESLLGKNGLAEFSYLANAEWNKIETLKPGDKTGRSTRERKIVGIMESLAKASGDVDTLIAIRKRSLASSWDYLGLAEICKQAERYDEALMWGEKGLATFKANPDNRLRDFVAEEYHRRKRYDDARNLYWQQLVEKPEPEYYKKLLGYAKKIKCVAEMRDQALQLLRQAVEKEKGNPKTRYWHVKPDHSRLVEIFLWEKDIENAWQEAQAGGCRAELWRELADQRSVTYPGDAAAVYRRLVEPVIDLKKNDAYAEAVEMLKKIRSWMKSAGQNREFFAYYADLKLRHKSKRNLMALLVGFERG